MLHETSMFSKLLNKNVPYCIIRLLMDGYVRQEAKLIWNSCHSTYYKLKNGVKQGRIYYRRYNTHRWLLGSLIGQYYIIHQFILRDIKFLHRLLQSPNSIVRQCIMNASSNASTLIGY